jgi:hypothetical protein
MKLKVLYASIAEPLGYLFRYDESLEAVSMDEDFHSTSTRVVVDLATFPIVRRTAKGCWIETCGARRFVLQTAHKQYAWPTRELALESFVIRKQLYVKYLRKRLDIQQTALDVAEAMQSGDDIRSAIVYPKLILGHC